MPATAPSTTRPTRTTPLQVYYLNTTSIPDCSPAPSKKGEREITLGQTNQPAAMTQEADVPRMSSPSTTLALDYCLWILVVEA